MFVYGLVDVSRPNEVRYVGKTTRAIDDRLKEHVETANFTKDYRATWIRSVYRNGSRVSAVPLCYALSLEHLDQVERDCIAQWRRFGARLTNLTEGGTGWTAGMRHSDEAKRKMSEKARAVVHAPHSPERKAKISASLIRKKHTRGVQKSIDHRTKISLSLKGRPLTESQKRNIAAAHYRRDPEVERLRRQKISEAARLQWAKRKEI